MDLERGEPAVDGAFRAGQLSGAGLVQLSTRPKERLADRSVPPERGPTQRRPALFVCLFVCLFVWLVCLIGYVPRGLRSRDEAQRSRAQRRVRTHNRQHRRRGGYSACYSFYQRVDPSA